MERQRGRWHHLEPLYAEPAAHGPGMPGIDRKLQYDRRSFVGHPGQQQQQHDRDHLSIRASLDDCATWKTDVYQITDGKSGYSDMVVFDDGSVGVLYENGPTHYSEQISFRKIPAATIAKYINE